MNKIQQLFERKQRDILNIYVTAGYPRVDSTIPILEALEVAGVDLIEIGMPYSDPLADGQTIQQSSQIALANGMSIPLLLKQLNEMKTKIEVPIILMGYLNPVLQYGMESFLADCQAAGVSGLILPDLPLWEYQQYYQKLFEHYGISNIFLITAQTSEDRIRLIDRISNSFIYVVSSSSTTGGNIGFGQDHIDYFTRIEEMQLKNPTLIGFGISNQKTYQTACKYGNGAIVGSAFIRMLKKSNPQADSIASFVKELRPA